MNFTSLFFISVGLAMDAFAVSLSEGLALKRIHVKHILRVALIFGFFQGIMPLIGWGVGGLFYDKIARYDHWIAFGLLTFIGGKMLWEARESQKCETEGKCDIASNIIVLGIATSIDALAVGFSFSLLPGLNIYSAVTVIGVITFIISSLGVYIGNKAGELLGYRAEYAGGIILIGMGVRILSSHIA
ncbi:putative manganese efflux pump MntP [Propionigenium maris DSM 9537]|uniref:Putative manganese efflux pump MntP n=1 Tax=Propionigenium maris DSM 9537 TaxID=1123000 RepID=A0A9W6GK63_9FUSO|nr:manganese efflux pump MntP family protein [Propionigenium maris]GLI55316.1 putative manganese efflux pump MntP [Propionigenium maris DSM 9537]